MLYHHPTALMFSVRWNFALDLTSDPKEITGISSFGIPRGQWHMPASILGSVTVISNGETKRTNAQLMQPLTSARGYIGTFPIPLILDQ